MGNSQLEGFADFTPDRDLPSLKGKVIFITGGELGDMWAAKLERVKLCDRLTVLPIGTAGIGTECIKALIKHEPEHIYFSGRNADSATRLISELQKATPS